MRGGRKSKRSGAKRKKGGTRNRHNLFREERGAQSDCQGACVLGQKELMVDVELLFEHNLLRTSESTVIIWHKKTNGHERLNAGESLYQHGISIIQYMCDKKERKSAIISVLRSLLRIALRGRGSRWYEEKGGINSSEDVHRQGVFQTIYAWIKLLEMYRRQEIDAEGLVSETSLDMILERGSQEEGFSSELEGMLFETMKIDKYPPIEVGVEVPKVVLDNISLCADVFPSRSVLGGLMNTLYSNVAEKISRAESSAKASKIEELVEIASYLHNGIVAIHPYEDGNGRLARESMRVLIWRLGFELETDDIKSKYESEYDQAVIEDYIPVLTGNDLDSIQTDNLSAFLRKRKLVRATGVREDRGFIREDGVLEADIAGKVATVKGGNEGLAAADIGQAADGHVMQSSRPL